MEPKSLLRTVTELFEHRFDERSLSCLLETLIRPVFGEASGVLYEPDAAHQHLVPGPAFGALVSGSEAPGLPEIEVGDLENPIGWSYVLKQAPAAGQLHSRATASSGYHVLQRRFSDNPWVHIHPLVVAHGKTALGVLAVFSPHQFPRAADTWRHSRMLTAAILVHRRRLHAQQSSNRDLQARLMNERDKATEAQRLREARHQFVGNDAVSRRAQRDIVNAARNDLAVLIQGETGTGKDLVASLIHQLSSRASQALVAVNCAAIPTELIEAELFGAKRGAFTGSVTDRKGLVEAARDGVLFLDEIGEMPYQLQAVLLRLLNEKTYRRIGEDKERRVDFRLICATNAPLQKMIDTGEFRKDLYYRICQVRIQTPPLREHLQDLPALAVHLTRLYNSETSEFHPGLSETQIEQLHQYDWPGNVRELKNFLFTFLATAHESDGEKEEMNIAELLAEWHNQVLTGSQPSYDLNALYASTDLQRARSTFEEILIRERLTQFNGSRKKAAASLGIPRRTLAYKCKKLEING